MIALVFFGFGVATGAPCQATGLTCGNPGLWVCQNTPETTGASAKVLGYPLGKLRVVGVPKTLLSRFCVILAKPCVVIFLILEVCIRKDLFEKIFSRRGHCQHEAWQCFEEGGVGLGSVPHPSAVIYAV